MTDSIKTWAELELSIKTKYAPLDELPWWTRLYVCLTATECECTETWQTEREKFRKTYITVYHNGTEYFKRFGARR